jgi:N12 class adenine-specific DNA methylase
MVRPLDKDKLKKAYKRFIQKNLDKLKRLDNGENKMFKDGKFVELKGSQFNREMRQEFVSYFARKKGVYDNVLMKIFVLVASIGTRNKIHIQPEKRNSKLLLRGLWRTITG